MADSETDLTALHQRFTIGLAYTQVVIARAKARKAATRKPANRSQQFALTRRVTARQLLRLRRMMAYVLRTVPGGLAKS